MPDTTPTDDNMRSRIRAAWLCGIVAACITTGRWPAWINKTDAMRLRDTAYDVAFGQGAFNPFLVWEMEAMIEKTMDTIEAGPKGKAATHGQA